MDLLFYKYTMFKHAIFLVVFSHVLASFFLPFSLGNPLVVSQSRYQIKSPITETSLLTTNRESTTNVDGLAYGIKRSWLSPSTATCELQLKAYVFMC